MSWVSPLDAAFLASESREHPMHLGGLLVFEKPAGAGRGFVGDLYRHLLTFDDVRPSFRRRPAARGPLIGAIRWHDDDDIDLEYHVRLSALPRPGRVRELLSLVSRLHGTLLDRHRPLWEFHLIEGMANGRFAVYYKLHHALVDGVNATRQTMQMFSADPAVTGLAPIWAQRGPAEPSPEPLPDVDSQRKHHGDGVARFVGLVSAIPDVVGQIGGAAPAVANLLAAGVRSEEVVLPFQAPKTMLNVPLSGARRFAAQSWSHQRMRAVAKAHGTTLNDVLLAMCAGALRRYLSGAQALPEESLVAAVPVALPVERGTDEGNAVTMVLCTLATDVDEPLERLHRIRASMMAAKSMMAGRTALQVSLLGLAAATGPSAASLVPGLPGRSRPPYNLVISNVPGPRTPMYWDRAPIVGWYPVSFPIEGQALNITAVSYAENIEFGLIGCRRSVPHLQRLLDDLERSLCELENSCPATDSTRYRSAASMRKGPQWP
jgi:diacylglycerol O-acyltransferase / wax synthase